MKRALKIAIVTAIPAGVLLVLLLALRPAPTRAFARDPAPSVQSGPDLTAEIVIDPPLPEPGQQVTVTVVVRNVGDQTSGAFTTYLYVDPVDRPPTPSTMGYPWGLPGLTPGNWSTLSRTYTFGTAGCDHVVYVWVDRDNAVAETNEDNNLVSETVCVGVTCSADTYEADNTCPTAGWITEGVTQSHTLCPDGDVDWVKFTAIGGVTYTLEATNLGTHADPLLYLYSSCGGSWQFGTGPSFEWRAPTSGIYYAQVEHREATHGPLAGYDLVLSSTGGPGDIYEPDDTCATSRDIPTDGTRQTHLFQAQADQDWVKFSVGSGDTFAVVADNTASGVSPLISLYSSCGQALSGQVDQSGQLSTTASTGQTYYARVANQNPDLYGPDAHYDLRVNAFPCVGDGYEDDDSAATATEIPTTGAVQSHNTCPVGDVDWVKFNAISGTLYVLETSKLGIGADTHLHLYDTDGQTELAHNDDYGYTLASRIIWQAPKDGVFYASVHHHNPNVAGVATSYELSIAKGRCKPDAFEPDNGALDAPVLVTDGQAQTHVFCADPLLSDVSDQDWVSFLAVGGSSYLIQTSDLGPNSDTVLNLYDRDRATLLASSDDYGPGAASAISITLPAGGTYYVQVVHYNSSQFGDATSYGLSVAGEVAPTPTPTPTPTPSPTPTPPSPQSTEVKTLIVVNRERVADLYSTGQADALMANLYELANHSSVQGAVVQVENDAAVASAYDAWTADQEALLDNSKANDVASAVRNLLMTFLNGNANIEYVVIVGDDRVIPFRRVPEGALSKTESDYAASVTISTTQWAAAQADMIMTDDYYVDKEPTSFQGGELYLPDYAIGRLIETPGEITAFIDVFLSDDVINVGKALVTGYDFVRDAGSLISTLFNNDTLNTDSNLIAISWDGDELRARQLQANPRFDLQSINGHSTHTSTGAPDLDDIQAGEVVTASSDLSGTLIFAVGCHAGLNDSGLLDLPQAFAQKKANYVANTGYGWGGGGIVYSEALMRNYAYELLVGTQARIGKAFAAAKGRYYANDQVFNAYDAKILMEATLYGLPMFQINSGGTFSPGDPFPSMNITSTAPTAFGEISQGRLDLQAGAFGESTTGDGTLLDIDGWSHFEAGAPVQPRFFGDVSAPTAGALHGAVFVGGTYSETQGFDPVIALPYNEYITSTAEPSFGASGWYPAVPFQVQTGRTLSTTAETLSASLGQYNSDTSTERVFGAMSLDTFYSDSPDTAPPTIAHVDGVLDGGSGQGSFKVEASDPSGIVRVVVAYTNGQGTWQSLDLAYQDTTGKWTGTIAGTAGTRFFVQVVDGGGNVSVDDNKGQYHAFSTSLPLIQGSGNTVYLPLVLKGG